MEILEVEIIIAEIKEFSGQGQQQKEEDRGRISELDIRAIEITQYEQQRGT